jgi:sporulation protein YlmC with PRC-barrel domain
VVGDIAAKTTGGQRINAFMVEKIIGSKVINMKGEALGKIEDLVVDIDTGFGMEVRLTVFIDKKEVLPVYLGPAFFILGTEQENYFKLGDEITVTGSQVTRGDEPFMLATTVKRGNEVLRLRDKDGNPEWIGWKKSE